MSFTHRVSRRHALCAAAAAALPVNAAPRAVTIGMATNEFRRHTNSALARELREAGIHTIQLFLTQVDSSYWKYCVRSDFAGLTPERSAEIADIYRTAGLHIHSIGVYINMIHADEAERKANLAYFDTMMKVGSYMGVRMFATEAGNYRPEGPPPKTNLTPYEWQEGVWRMMVATGKELARIADAHDATVMLEPGSQGFLATAKRTRQFLEALTGDKSKDLKLIGQFGVGFYSSFIVAEKVTLITRRAGLGPEHGVRWESAGQGEYVIETVERK